MSPEDADEQFLLNISSSSKLPHSNGFNAVMADGHVTFIHAELSEKIRKALTTVDGGEGHQVY
jgi:prepilin-type processing-associated H-X9-DG protein